MFRNGNGTRGKRRNRSAISSRNNGGQRQNALVQPPRKVPLGTVVTRELARMRMDPTQNGIIVRNREILRVISRTATTGTYQEAVDSIGFLFSGDSGSPVSPGSGNLDQSLWLSQLARLYDKFIVRKLSYEFVSSMPFTVTGQVGMYFDSDNNPINPTTFQQLSGNVYAESVQVSQPLTLVVRPNQLNRLPQYVVSATSTGDSGVGRVGVLQFVNQAGITNAVNVSGPFALGALWIDYEVEFLNPSNPNSAFPPIAPSEPVVPPLVSSVNTTSKNPN